MTSSSSVVLRGIGVDPGLARTGIAAVERRPDGTWQSRGVRLVASKPDHTKKQRVSTDDERRIRLVWTELRDCVRAFKPHALCVENYTVYGERDTAGLKTAARDLVSWARGAAATPAALAHALQDAATLGRLVKGLDRLQTQLDLGSEVVGVRGRGKAAKTLSVYGAILAVGWEHDIPVFVDMPIDLKVQFCSRKNASKDDVAKALGAFVVGLDDDVRMRIRGTEREHVYDAAGHAVLGVRHYMESLGAAGLRALTEVLTP